MTIAVPSVAYTNNDDGTVDAVVTGATAGTTNTLMTAPINTAWSDLLVWTDRDAITGDGTIVSTIPGGVYIAAVRSELVDDLVYSVPGYLQVTNSANKAPLNSLLKAVQATVIALSLEDFDAANIVVGTVPDASFIEGLSAPTIVVANPGTEQFIDTAGVPNNVYRRGWPVLVCLAAPANYDQSEALREKWFNWRDQIQHALLYNIFPGGLPGIEWMIEPILTPRQVVYDTTWWEKHALGAPVSIFYRVDKALT